MTREGGIRCARREPSRRPRPRHISEVLADLQLGSNLSGVGGGSPDRADTPLAAARQLPPKRRAA